MVTDRFFQNPGTDQIQFRLIRFGFGYDRTNRGATNRKNSQNRTSKLQEQHKSSDPDFQCDKERINISGLQIETHLNVDVSPPAPRASCLLLLASPNLSPQALPHPACRCAPHLARLATAPCHAGSRAAAAHRRMLGRRRGRNSRTGPPDLREWGARPGSRAAGFQCGKQQHRAMEQASKGGVG